MFAPLVLLIKLRFLRPAQMLIGSHLLLTILAGTSSALDGMTFMHNNVGQTRIFALLNLSFILRNLLS